MRRHFLMASAGAIALAGSAASAAEPPIVPPPPPVPVFTWTGIYLGGQVGFAWESGNLIYTGNDPLLKIAFSASVNPLPSGVIGGAHVGYNYQIDQWVVGLEGTVDATSFSNTLTVNLPGVFGGSGLAAQTNSSIQGSIRGRAGIAWDRALIYATGGVAFGGISTNYTLTGNTNATALNGGNTFNGSNGFSSTRTGWTAGGGMGYAVTDNWSVFAEYRYTRFGTISSPGIAASVFSAVPGLTGAFLNANRPLNQNQVQVGFSYRFGTYPLAPIVAKY